MAKTITFNRDEPHTTSNSEQKVLLCAANNVDLYQSIFSAHRLADRRTSALWSSDGLAPPFYSNLCTLDPDATGQQMTEIGRLRAALGSPFSVKDGFNRPDLTGDGFRVLFSSSWIWRDPGEIPAVLPPRWSRIRDAISLDSWERSWKMSGSPTPDQVFTPAVLSDPNLHFYGRLADDGFDAGCIANQSPEVVGISNIFNRSGKGSIFADAISAAAAAFSPDLPLVGYDSGAALDEVIRLGFRSVGPLRIWHWDGS